MGSERLRVGFGEGIYQLRKLAKDHGVSPEVARRDWIKEGRPSKIDSSFFERSKKKDRRVAPPPGGAKYYEVDGHLYSAKELVQMYDIPQATLDTRRARWGKTKYTSKELESMAESVKLKREQAKHDKKRRPWARGPSVTPPGEGMTPMERSLARLMI